MFAITRIFILGLPLSLLMEQSPIFTGFKAANEIKNLVQVYQM